MQHYHRLHKNNIDFTIHCIAALCSAYTTHGTYKNYEEYRLLLQNDAYLALDILDVDLVSEKFKRPPDITLQEYCTRALCIDFIKFCIKELAAYQTWLSMYNAYLDKKFPDWPIRFRRLNVRTPEQPYFMEPDGNP